jgi:hypothetical protein
MRPEASGGQAAVEIGVFTDGQGGIEAADGSERFAGIGRSVVERLLRIERRPAPMMEGDVRRPGNRTSRVGVDEGRGDDGNAQAMSSQAILHPAGKGQTVGGQEGHPRRAGHGDATIARRAREQEFGRREPFRPSRQSIREVLRRRPRVHDRDLDRFGLRQQRLERRADFRHGAGGEHDDREIGARTHTASAVGGIGS